MSPRKRKSEVASRAPRARSTHSRQRQRLIDACISALHIYGPSRTTVEKVVAIAKMSPGIVRFYFDSKAAMLVASLQFLAAEFEEQVLVPVAKLKHNPVAALELLVDLYLDPEIASPRKVSVWYAFWGEASSRQEYYDICGQKDESFAAMVRELIGRMIEDTGQSQLDPGGVALGLIGALEMLWQDFAFQSEDAIDRQAAKRRCMAYLKSVFPARFDRSVAHAGGGSPAARQTPSRRFAGWVYGHERAFSLERDLLFHSAWQVAAHESQIAHAGDFMAVEVGVERVLLTRDAFGIIHALRNSCPEVPHALTTTRSGRFGAEIECRIHGLKFALNGARQSAAAPVDLKPLPVLTAAGFVLVRSTESASQSPAAGVAGWLDGKLPAGLRAHEPAADLEVAADWKMLVEQWLEHATPDTPPGGGAEFISWRARSREGQPSPPSGASQRFLAPNQLLQIRADGVSVLQVIPTAPGRCRLRRIDLSTGESLAAAQHASSGLSLFDGRTAIEIAESAQRGVAEFGYRGGSESHIAAPIAWFRQHVLFRVPPLALDGPPNASS